MPPLISKIPVLLLLAALYAVSSCNNDALTDPELDFEVIDAKNFTVGNTPVLMVENPIGDITVTADSGNTVSITATRRTSIARDLERISTTMTEENDTVYVSVNIPEDIEFVEINFEITVPAGTLLDIENGVGAINYTGAHRGDWELNTFIGSILLNLPAELNISLDLRVSSGKITTGYAVEGEITETLVRGTIGSGEEGSIFAQAGIGDITINHE